MAFVVFEYVSHGQHLQRSGHEGTELMLIVGCLQPPVIDSTTVHHFDRQVLALNWRNFQKFIGYNLLTSRMLSLWFVNFKDIAYLIESPDIVAPYPFAEKGMDVGESA